MRHTMKNETLQITEGLASDISSQLVYCFFIDLYSLANQKGGLLTIMFPNVGSRKLSKWVSTLPESEIYTTNIDGLKSISEKFAGVTALKSLYRVINGLKSKETKPEENDARISDITMVMGKIQKIIKSRLTTEEQELFAKLSLELKAAADNASKSIEGSVGASTEQAEKPKEEPEETPTETPTEPTSAPPAEEKPKEEPTETSTEEKPEEKPEEEPEEEPKKTESVNFNAHLKSLVKEIVRKKLGL